MHRVGGLRTRLVPSVAAFDAHEWDALVRDEDFFHSHAWLRGLDHALGASEVLAVDGPGGLAAGCALWHGERDAHGLFALGEFFADVGGPWRDEFLWLGARRATHNELPCVPGTRRREALACLVDAALELAERRGLAGVVVPYMPLDRAQELADGRLHAQVLLHSAEASVPVPNGGLDAMLASWGAHRRARSKAELSAFERHGNRVEWTALDDGVVDTAVRLIAANRARYGSMQGEDWVRRMLAGQRQSGALDLAVAAVARRDGRVSAVTIFYRFGNALHSRYFGSDYSIADNDFRYFALAYYLPLNYAAGRGLKQYRPSTSALDAKVHRGSLLEPQAAFVALTGGARLDAGEVERHNARFLDDYRCRYGAHLTPAWSGAVH